MKKLLYLGPSGIGDWCFIYPSLPALLEENNAQQADLILPYQNDGNALLEHNEMFGSIRYLQRSFTGVKALSYLLRWLRLLKAIRRQKYETVAISYLSNQPDMLLLALLSGAKKRIGRVTGEGLLDRLAINTPARKANAEDRVSLHNSYTSGKKNSVPPLITLAESAKPHPLFEKHHIRQPYIVLGIGGGRNASWRFWPAENFAQLINSNKRYQWILLGGGDDDQQQAEEILSRCENLPVHNLVNKTSMLEAVTLIDSAEGVIGNDSGIANLSAIMQIPTICLYGPTSARLTGPALNGAQALQMDLPCQPCFGEPNNPSIAIACPHKDCLKLLSAKRVNMELQRLLSRGGGEQL